MKRLKKLLFHEKKAEAGFIAVTAVLFLTIAVGALYLLLAPKQFFSEDENRVLEPFPQISMSSVRDGSFMDSAEAFVGDHFMLRKAFVSLNTRVQLWMGKRDLAANYSTTPAEGGVYFGGEGHIYEVLLPNHTDVFQRNVAGLKIFAEKTGLPCYILPVPSGSQEQQDRLPAFAPNHNQQEEFRALQSSLDAKATVVDLFDRLSDKTGKDCYFKTDHHWNIYGAYQGYQALVEAMGYPAAPLEDFDLRAAPNAFYGTLYSKAPLTGQAADTLFLPYYKKAMDLTQQTGKQTRDSIYWEEFLTKKDKYSAFLGGNHSVDVIRNSRVTNGKKLLLLKDSFANSMIPFLATNFEEIHMIDLRYYNQNVYSYIRQNGITETAAVYSIKQLCEVSVANKLTAR